MSRERKEDMSSFSEGQTHLLMDALEKKGFTPSHVTKLGQFSNIAGIMAVLDGQAEIRSVGEDMPRWIKIDENTILVNFGAAPKLPFDGAKLEQHLGEGWSIVQKRKKGLYVRGIRVLLYLSQRQKGSNHLKGYELRDELVGRAVLNANLLDALYENPHLIPDDWKEDSGGNIRYIYFWGTGFGGRVGFEYVRCFYFHGGGWLRSYDWLDCDWSSRESAAVLAGPSVRVPLTL